MKKGGAHEKTEKSKRKRHKETLRKEVDTTSFDFPRVQKILS